MRADALANITHNFKTLQCTWHEAFDVVRSAEMKARIQGVCSMMYYFYCNILGENLSSSLQNKIIPAAEGQQIAQMTVLTMH